MALPFLFVGSSTGDDDSGGLVDGKRSPNAQNLPVVPIEELAFDAAFRAEYAGMCEFVRRYLRNEANADQVAEDLVQEVWLSTWRLGDAKRLAPSYLYVAARNRALRHLRDRATRLRHIAQIRLSPASDDVVTPETLSTADDLTNRLNRAIEALPPRCREVFTLVRIQGWSHADVAERLGISRATVEVQIWKALKALRLALEGSLSILLLIFASIPRF